MTRIQRISGKKFVMKQQFEAEINEFHEVLTRWFSGTLPRTEQGFSGLANVLA